MGVRQPFYAHMVYNFFKENRILITLTQIQLRLTESIRQSGMTQTELAKALNVSQQTVSCYKSGKKMPALDTLANLCKILDIDANYILCQD